MNIALQLGMLWCCKSRRRCSLQRSKSLRRCRSPRHYNSRCYGVEAFAARDDAALCRYNSRRYDVVALSTLCCSSQQWPNVFFFSFFYSTLVASRVFKAPLVSKKERYKGRERKRGRFYSSAPGYITPLWSHSSQLLCSQLLLVGRGVQTQAPFNSNNTTTRNTRSNTTSKRKFKAKRNLLFSTLNNK